MQPNAVLHEGGVGPAAKRVHARKDIGEMVAQMVHRHAFAVVPKVGVAVAAREDEDAPTGRTSIGFDDKVGAIAQDRRQLPKLRVVFDGREYGRRGHADAGAKIAHVKLVVDQGKQGSRVVVEDAFRVPAIHRQDAEFRQLLSAE